MPYNLIPKQPVALFSLLSWWSLKPPFFASWMKFMVHTHSSEVSSAVMCQNNGHIWSPRISVVPKMEGFQITLFWAVLGMGIPLHKPYPYSLYRWGFFHFRYWKVWWFELGRALLRFVGTQQLFNDIHENRYSPMWNSEKKRDVNQEAGAKLKPHYGTCGLGWVFV